MKKLSHVAALLLLFISPIVLASPINYGWRDFKGEHLIGPILCPVTCLHDGFYLGVGLGYDFFKVTQSATVIAADGDRIFVKPTLNMKGSLGSLFLGYGQYYGWFYYAGEVFANENNAEASYSLTAPRTSYQTNVKSRVSYGASILPGIRLAPSLLLYARIAYVRTFFKTMESGTGASGTFYFPTTKWENGVHLGAGLESAFYKNVSARLEYTYTNYGSFLSSRGTQFSPANNEVVLGLIYHFC